MTTIFRSQSQKYFIDLLTHKWRHNHISNLLDTASCHSDEIILTGDFNVDVLNTKNPNCKLTKICCDAGLKQLINTATREGKGGATLLDHLYTTHEDRITEILVPVYGLSDHYPICFTHKFGRGKYRKHHHEKLVCRSSKNFSSREFINDLHTVPWSVLDAFSDVDGKLAIWNTLFTNVMNEHVPLVARRVTKQTIARMDDS